MRTIGSVDHRTHPRVLGSNHPLLPVHNPSLSRGDLGSFSLLRRKRRNLSSVCVFVLFVLHQEGVGDLFDPYSFDLLLQHALV